MRYIDNATHGRLAFLQSADDVKWSAEARERGFVEVSQPCGRCGGAGGADCWKFTGWTCYECGGAGVSRKSVRIYTVERRAELDRINEKRRATLDRKRREAEAVARAEREAAGNARKVEHAAAFAVLEPVLETLRELVESKCYPDARAELEAGGVCPFVVDVAANWAQGFKVSDAMLEAVPGAAEKWAAGAERKAERERLEAERVERAVEVAAIAGNGVDLCGRVLAIKDKATDYGVVEKMLFEDDRGFRLWGSVPRALMRALIDAEAVSGSRGNGGDDYDAEHSWHLVDPRPRVEFVANVEASDDRIFGFFKRPRKAEVLEAAETKEGRA